LPAFASSMVVGAVHLELVVLDRVGHLEEQHQEELQHRVVLKDVRVVLYDCMFYSPIPGGAMPGGPP
jgi:hypothetical protein